MSFTPAQERGMIVGELFSIIADEGDDGEFFRKGEVVMFSRDDSSDMPAFSYFSREGGQRKSGDSTFYTSILNVYPVKSPAVVEANEECTVLKFKKLLNKEQINKIMFIAAQAN